MTSKDKLTLPSLSRPKQLDHSDRLERLFEEYLDRIDKGIDKLTMVIENGLSIININQVKTSKKINKIYGVL
jgi:hypothetical protein